MKIIFLLGAILCLYGIVHALNEQNLGLFFVYIAGFICNLISVNSYDKN